MYFLSSLNHITHITRKHFTYTLNLKKAQEASYCNLLHANKLNMLLSKSLFFFFLYFKA